MGKIISYAKNPLIISIVIYLITVAFINPFTHFAVNDDWDFYVHIRNFRQGDFVKNSLIDSAYILQGLIGTAWTYVFGFSYPALKALTVLITVLFLTGVYKTLNLLIEDNKVKLVALLTVVFNPFIHVSSMTFMTEMYFLLFVIWSVYFLLLYEKTRQAKYLILAVAVASCSTLVRQIGLLHAPAVLVAGLYIERLKNKTVNLVKYIPLLFIIISTAVIALKWPQYNSDNETPVDIILKSVVSLTEFDRIFNNLYYFLPYIGLTIFPFGIYAFLFQLPRKWKIGVLVVTVLLFMSFYKYDIFKLGNVLYPEGLMIKSNYTYHVSGLNNIPFKLAFNGLVLISTFSFIGSLILNITQLKTSKYLSLLFITSALIFPILMHRGFYDRYVVNGGVVLVVIAAGLLSTINRRKEIIILFALSFFYMIYTFALSQDYLTTTKIQWQHAEKLTTEVQLKKKIFLSGAYTRYTSVYPKPNDENLVRAVPVGLEYQCYIQKHVEYDKSNLIFKILNRLDTSKTVENIAGNPRPYDLELLPGYRLPPSNPDKLKYKEEYFSLPEVLIGNKSFIVTYCEY